jgi:arginase
MTDIDRVGVERSLREALEFLAGASFLHVSFDLDAVDPMFAPGVGTPVRGGLSYREAHLALELVAESSRLDSLELVELNPILDRENETGQLAVELAASALGARIL